MSNVDAPNDANETTKQGTASSFSNRLSSAALAIAWRSFQRDYRTGRLISSTASDIFATPRLSGTFVQRV